MIQQCPTFIHHRQESEHGQWSYDFNVWSERKRIEKLRYMHRNPVKRGLVERPEDWKWSSFRSYALGDPGVVRIHDWQVLKMKTRAA